MRPGMILVMGLFLASVALPPTHADARPLLLKILRAGPQGPIFGGGRQIARPSAYQARRAAAIRAAQARAVARSAAPAAAVAGVAGATAATAATNPSDTQPADNANQQIGALATTGTASSGEPKARAGEPPAPARPQLRLGTVGPLA